MGSLLLMSPPGGLPAPQRGIALGLFASEHRLAVYAPLLEEIRAAGATRVELVLRWSQARPGSTRIQPSAATPSDAVVMEVIAAARKLGLKVALLPTIHIQGRGWRGEIPPSPTWWKAYRRFLLHVAHLAARGGVDLLSVGSELVLVERDAASWRALIAEVRGVFRGRLTYSANWDHYAPITFWDALDAVSISAYPSLGDATTEAELVQAWAGARARIEAFARARGKPLILSEVGYPGHALAARRPWDYGADAPRDLALQARCYAAFFRAWAGTRAEIYLWNWFGRPQDAGYSPRGKPALKVLRRWYRSPAAGGAP